MVKSVNVPVLKNFIENILNDKECENEDSSDEDLTIRQENILEDATNIGDNIPQNEEEIFLDADVESMNGEEQMEKLVQM